MSQSEYFGRKRQLHNNSNLSQLNLTAIKSTNSRQPLGELTNLFSQQSEQNTVKRSRILNETSTNQTDSINVSRRNERERNRVKLLNLGFDRLRAVVPCQTGEQLSKISTLKKAIWYIEHLDKVLHGQENRTNLTEIKNNANCSEISQEIRKPYKTCSVASTRSTEFTTGIRRDGARSGTSWNSMANHCQQVPTVTTLQTKPFPQQQCEPFTSTPSHRRPVLQLNQTSPIFPTNWDLVVNELNLPNKFTDADQQNNYRKKSADSGYESSSRNEFTSDRYPVPISGNLSALLTDDKLIDASYINRSQFDSYMNK